MSSVLFGTVIDNVDPDKLGRVQVRLTDWTGDIQLPWLRVLQPLASTASAAAWFVPEKEDHVVVLCGPGGTDGMVVIGSVHTGKTRKPVALADGAAGDPMLRGILTPAGNEISIDDTKDKEKIVLRTKDGKVSITLDGKETSLLVEVEKDVTFTVKGDVVVTCENAKVTTKKDATVDASKGKVTVTAKEVEVTGKSGVKIMGAKVDIAP